MVRVQEGDDQAFSTLLDRHLSAIHAFAFRMLRNAEDAEDVAQDVFVRIWNKSGTYQPGRVQFTTWLHQVAHNLAVDRMRRSKPTVVDFDVDTLPSVGDGESGNRVEIVNRTLHALPERQRTALTLCTVQGLSARQASKVLGISVSALESLLSRARGTLRKVLRIQDRPQ